MTHADEFRAALGKIIICMDKEYVDICAGNLHRVVGGYPGKNHKMPICSSVMKTTMSGDDVILQSPPKGNGASLVIRYYSKNHESSDKMTRYSND